MSHGYVLVLMVTGALCAAVCAMCGGNALYEQRYRALAPWTVFALFCGAYCFAAMFLASAANSHALSWRLFGVRNAGPTPEIYRNR